MPEVVQGTGFEPAQHYAQRPERCPFDRSGTPAWNLENDLAYIRMANAKAKPQGRLKSGAGSRIRTYEALRTGT